MLRCPIQVIICLLLNFFTRDERVMDSDLHPVDDYSHRFFIWHEWIQANGPLNTENVFDYFATSMFYDKQSNNQVLRMQTMHTGTAIANEAEELRCVLSSLVDLHPMSPDASRGSNSL